MNDLTREIVEYCAGLHRASALKNSDTFKGYVNDEYWARLMLDFGVDRKFHAVALFGAFHPDCVDVALGYALTDDLEVAISDIVVRSIERRIADNPAIQLDDYGNLPVITVDRLVLQEEQAKIEAKAAAWRAKQLAKTDGMEQLKLL